MPTLVIVLVYTCVCVCTCHPHGPLHAVQRNKWKSKGIFKKIAGEDRMKEMDERLIETMTILYKYFKGVNGNDIFGS